MSNNLQQLEIRREVWAPGRRHGYGLLSFVFGRRAQCCLGILGTALGARDLDILAESLPVEVGYACTWPEALDLPSGRSAYRGADPDDWQTVFASLNDYEPIDDVTRESWIATGFRLVLGIEVTFSGQYPDGPRGWDGEIVGEVA